MAAWDSYVQQLTDKAKTSGVTAENYGDVFAHHANPEGSNLESIFGDLSASIDARAEPTGGRQVDSQSPEGDYLYGSGTGNASNTPGLSSSGRASGATGVQGDQLSQLLDAIRGMNKQPDVDLSGIQPGDMPNFEVPGLNLSPGIDATLQGAMNGEGSDPLGLNGRLTELLNSLQGGGINSGRLDSRLEGAREALTGAEKAASGDMMARLGERGLVSMPGSPQGMELDATMRTLEPLQRAYLGEVRKSYEDESMLADQHELDALAAATGWSHDQVNSKLAAATSATQRQQMMSEIALQSLQQNAEWNQFLAEFGLKREEVAAQIQQGRVDSVMPLLQMFAMLVGQSRGGYI